MCGGGKGLQQTSQSMAMPNPAAMAAYNQAMSRIDAATSKPFQRYSSDPEAYVASLNPVQTSAIQNVAGMAGMTDPYFQGATGLTFAGAAPVGRLTGAQIQEYMSPYMSQVVDPVRAALQQQQGQQLSQQQTEAIKAGAFGGDRAGLQRAMLRGQQQLGLGQALSPLYAQGYGQALQAAQGQQAIEAANLQRLLGAGAQIGGLGTAAQQAALQQASAQLQAGTLGQQTSTAQKQALYGEAQKERMYPLQVAQLYAQAAGALGPLMGSTTQGYQQMPFFGGFADGGSAGKEYDEGLGRARMGGAVTDGGDYSRGGYADGGVPSFDEIVAQQRNALAAPMAQQEEPFPVAEFKTSPLLRADLPEQRTSGGLGSMLSKGADVARKGFDVRRKLEELPQGASFLDKASAFFADGGSVEDDGMSDILNNPITPSRQLQPDQPQPSSGGGLGGLLKTGAGMASNYFLPGSGPLVSAGLGALGLAEGGRAGYEEGGLTPEEADYYLRPLARIESGGRRDPYATVGPATKYGRALGKYQVMEGNVPEWSKAALGRALTKEEFLADKDAQEAVARHRFGQYLSQAGTPEKAAAMWFGGPGYEKHMGARDVLGTSIPQYMAKYKAGLGEADLSRLGPRERSMMALYPDRPTTEASGPSAGLGSAQVREKGFLERTQEHPESLILPILQGIGAMAGSKNRYALGAIAEGLGAGAGSYMDIAGKQAEIDKRRQEIATEAEETRRRGAEATRIGGIDTQKVQAEIDAIRAGLYQTVVVPGEGVLLINKSNPQAGYTKIMEADGTPVPGKEHIATEIQKQPEGAPPVTPRGPTEAAHPWETQAVTEPPKGYRPAGQATLALDERAAAEAKTRGYEEAEKARAAGSDASRNVMRISEMEEAVKNLEEPKGGWMTKQGPWADQRLNLAKNINFLTSAITGKAPIPESEISSMEVLNKDAFRLGSSAVSALQGHPAQAIIQQSVVATPSLANTRMGYQRLLAGLKMAAQYEQDRGKFFSNYYNKFHNTLQAQEAFDQFNPPQEYARRAVASVIDPRHMEALRKYGSNIKDKIDAIYGAGTTATLMGQ